MVAIKPLSTGLMTPNICFHSATDAAPKFLQKLEIHIVRLRLRLDLEENTNILANFKILSVDCRLSFSEKCRYVNVAQDEKMLHIAGA